jgi:hypothetical protein
MATNKNGAGQAASSKIVITVGDTQAVQVTSVVNQIEAAKQVPLVREIGDSKSTGSSALVPTLILTGAGAVGGLLVWVVWGLLPTADDSQTANIQTSVSIAMVLALVLVLADALQSMSAGKLGKALLVAIPVALAGSFLFGYIASELYTGGVRQIWDSLVAQGYDPVNDLDTFIEQFTTRNHLNRGTAWMFMGAATGLAVGASTLAAKRVVITGVGGLFGAFVGGFAFDFFAGEDQAQIVGLALTGSAIGLSMGLLEQVVKSSWLQITQGGMAGKQFIVYKNEVTVGSSPGADVTLIKDPSIPGIACRILKRGSVTTIESMDSQRPVIVDGVAATHKITLRHGSVIQLGGTAVVYNERSKSDVNASIVRS